VYGTPYCVWSATVPCNTSNPLGASSASRLHRAVTTRLTIYDSSETRAPLVTEFRNLREFRGLLRLLVTRDFTVRYKRSCLVVWWTLLNPLLTMSVLWIVLSQIFRFEIARRPVCRLSSLGHDRRHVFRSRCECDWGCGGHQRTSAFEGVRPRRGVRGVIGSGRGCQLRHQPYP
jgi:hypothetical protein